jgi:DNA-3-methyladenine glycosylase I
MANSYCAAVRKGIDDWNRVYHDTEYGFPLRDENELFERLILEINQAGLSWLTILKKRENFKKAYSGFAVDRVAKYTDRDRERLLADAGIIRNRLKVNAAIENARRIQDLRKTHGGIAQWLDAQHPMELADWSRLFKKQFVFTGGEIVREFLVSAGYLAGAHDTDCPIHRKVLRLKPPWTKQATA